MQRSEYQANQDMQREIPAWQKPSKIAERLRACRHGYYQEKTNKWWHAVVIGVIISIPFIVEIIKNVV